MKISSKDDERANCHMGWAMSLTLCDKLEAKGEISVLSPSQFYCCLSLICLIYFVIKTHTHVNTIFGFSAPSVTSSWR